MSSDLNALRAQAVSYNFGWAVAYHLSAILVVQTLRYWRAFSDDHWLRKTGVLVLLGLNLQQLGSYIYIQYTATVLSFANPTLAITIQTSTPAVFSLMNFCLTIIVVQLFYLESCYKIYGRNIKIVSALGLLVFANFVLNFASNIILLTTPSLGRSILAMIDPGLRLGCLIMTLVTDITITGTLVFGFLRLRSGKANLDGLLVRLSRGIFESAIIPCVFMAITVFFHFYRKGLSPIYYGFVGPIGALYAVTLLHTLLLRVSVRQEFQGKTEGGDIVRVQAPAKALRKNSPSVKVSFDPSNTPSSDLDSARPSDSKHLVSAGFTSSTVSSGLSSF